MGRGEGDATIVELEQAGEVEEMALRSFGAEVAKLFIRKIVAGEGPRDSPRVLACRANATCEHEIEQLRLPNFVTGIRISQVMLAA